MDGERPPLEAGANRSVPLKRSSRAVIGNPRRHEGGAAAPRRDWRRVHHSPWFWVGATMFLAAILTYVFSEDLSLRPRLHGSAERFEGRSPVIPPTP